MEFDNKHYVPVLRWKSAEQKALQDLSFTQKDHITPIIEIVNVKSDTGKTITDSIGRNFFFCRYSSFNEIKKS